MNRASVLAAAALSATGAGAASTGPSRLERLGARIFNDPALSSDRKTSCATCHQAQRAFTDGLRVARGTDGREGTRNTPTLIDARLQNAFFWDGRRLTLEAQVTDPLVNPNEHGLADLDVVVARVASNPSYLHEFRESFGPTERGSAATVGRIRAALAAFVRSLVADDSPFDRYAFHGEAGALTAAQKRGLQLFQGRANCSSCHRIDATSAPLTDGEFHGTILPEAISANLEALTTLVSRADFEARSALLSANAGVAALGRFVVTLDPADIGRFRTPSLRNVAVTGPYFHDGSVGTLSGAVVREAYARGDLSRRQLILTPAEVADLVAFLRSLTSKSQAAAGAQRTADTSMGDSKSLTSAVPRLPER